MDFSVNNSREVTNSSLTAENCLLPLGHVCALMVVNILSTIIGTVGNVLVIGTVFTVRSLQIISNFWLVSMAVADLQVTALGQPSFTIFLGLQTRRECNETISQTFRFISNISCAVSVLHLVLISIDRCLLVVRPHDFRSIRTMTRFKIALAIVWTLPIIYAVLRIAVSKKGTSYFTVMAAGVCYVIIICCYTLIILKIRKQGRATLKRMGSHRGQSSSEHMVERRVTVTIAIVVVIFTVCWFPMLYLRSIQADSNFSVAYNWARTLALSNSSMNPWIYCFRIAEFREAYKKLLSCNGKLSSRGFREQHELNTTQSSDLGSPNRV